MRFFICFLSIVLGRLTCPGYEEIATPVAAHLSTTRYQGFWYEVYSHNVVLVDSCQCTRYNFTMTGTTTFTDVFTCHKNSPTSDPYVINNKGSVDANTPGKMVESLGPVSPPYWVLSIWDSQGKQITTADTAYSYALVYACVGSPLLGEYTYFFSRTDTIPDPVFYDMYTYASDRNISLTSVKKIPMDGCQW